MLKNEGGMAQSLYEGTNLNITCIGIFTQFLPLLNAQGICRSDYGLTLIAQFILHLSNHCINLVTGQLIHQFVIVVCIHRMVLHVQMDGPERQLRGILNMTHGQGDTLLPGILHQLLQSHITI